MKGKFDPIPEQYSKELQEVIGKLLTLDYHERPSIQDILDMPAVR